MARFMLYLVGIVSLLLGTAESTQRESIHLHAVECSYLPNPANGVVTQMGTSPGSLATYTCNGGFVVVGTATLVCQADGQWSGDAPTCTASEFYSKLKSCYYLNV